MVERGHASIKRSKCALDLFIGLPLHLFLESDRFRPDRPLLFLESFDPGRVLFSTFLESFSFGVKRSNPRVRLLDGHLNLERTNPAPVVCPEDPGAESGDESHHDRPNVPLEPPEKLHELGPSFPGSGPSSIPFFFAIALMI